MMNKKLAALDIGTNSFHLIVVSVSHSGSFEIIEREKEVIRLSEGNIGDIKFITPNSTERAIAAINKFNKIAESYGATLRAVATSAVRESLNKNEFLKSVYERTGVKVEVISGLEEARLIYLGILKAVPVFDVESLSIDIGGGSTEFIVGKKGKIEYSNSLKLGAVRLSQMFFPNFVLTAQKIEEARKWVEGIIAPVISKIKNRNIESVVGSSGTILNIGMMIRALRNEGKGENLILNNFEFSADEFQEIEAMVLNKKTLEERKNITGLEDKRVDIIPAGVIILSTIFKKLDIKKLIISDYALKEGIILDLVDKQIVAKF
ncbi:MAG: Ppx/GppA family phosphatase [Melioribacteraceae bacterium]|nr:Ppx/GppA family phosphatase [Melioribacteraceae bacterium]